VAIGMEGALWLVVAVVGIAAAVTGLTWWARRMDRRAAERRAEQVRASQQKAQQPERDEERAKAVIAAAEQGRFLPLPPGSVSFGAEAGEEAYYTCPAEHAATHESGAMYVTDRRVLFVSKEKRLSLTLGSIDRVDHPFENALRLIDETSPRSEVFFADSPREAAAYILVLKRWAGRRSD